MSDWTVFFFSLLIATWSDEVSTSLIDLLFSHVVSDHWTGQKNPALSDTSVQEVRVSVQEVGFLPATSNTPLELESYEGSDEAAKQQEHVQHDRPSDCKMVIVPDSKLDDTVALPLR